MIEVRPQWLAQVVEEPIEPGRRVVDPHHHFFRAGSAFPFYDLAELRADTAGHRVTRTVFVQCGEAYYENGPVALRPVGETAWVEDIAREAAREPGATQVAAIVGTADLRLGAAVREVLEAHRAASARFRGVRQMAAFDSAEGVYSVEGIADADLYGERSFREGFAVLAELGLSFDAWHYHHQTPALTALARAFPAVPIVLDHFGTPLGVGPYAGREEEIYATWARDLAELARCPNVMLKVGGLAMPWNGFGFERAARPPDSDELVARQGR